MRVINLPVKIAVSVMAALLASAVLQAAPAPTPAPVIASLAAVPAPEARVIQAKAAIKSALGEVKSVKGHRWKIEVLTSIAAAQAKAGDVSGALLTAERIKDAETGWMS